MKILLMGDYSNCHRTLATGLRRLGHDVTVASNGSHWLDTERDIDLSRRGDKLGGLRLYLDLRYRLHDRLRGYDIVSINNPGFVELRPERTRRLFDRLKRDNRAVFLTAMGSDLPYLDLCEAADSPLKYNEWFIDGRPAPYNLASPGLWEQWHSPELSELHSAVYNGIDGAVSVLYEYDLAIRRALPAGLTAYGGLPIDTRAITPVDIDLGSTDKVRIFLGRHRGRLVEKGTDLLETAARRVVERHPDRAELVIVENRPYREYIELLRSAHIVLDQIYSYTPAINALLAMAYGLNVVSGGEPEYYDFIGERDNRPVINAVPELEGLTSILEAAVLDRSMIAERGRRSREFVERHNDCDIVARRFLSFWESRLKQLNR